MSTGYCYLYNEVIVLVDVGYSFYKETYGGVLEEGLFTKLKHRANKLISYYTSGRVDMVSDTDDNVELVSDIRYCVCSIIDKLQSYSEDDDKTVVSRTAGKTSESYVVSDRAKSMESDIRYEIDLYLSKYSFTCMWVL